MATRQGRGRITAGEITIKADQNFNVTSFFN